MDQDTLLFFNRMPQVLPIYQAWETAVLRRFPDTRIKVQATQISFYNRRLYACASLPVRRRKDWPAICLIVTLGLPERLDSPRIALAAEPYPGRWTHHFLLTHPGQVDEELLEWTGQAYQFSMNKR